MSVDIGNDLTGKTALITGASSGLGERFAHVLAKAGARVIIAARRKERLTDLQKTITDNGGDAHAMPLDVNQYEAIPAFFDDLAKDGLLPDILVNNAGLSITKPATETTLDEYNTVMGTNVTAPFFLSTELAKRQIAEKIEGRIVNIASVASFTVLPGNTSYNISKIGDYDDDAWAGPRMGALWH